ncbi:MAG: hypothetical protein ACP5NZ_03115 [Nanobdellota archaeon]
MEGRRTNFFYLKESFVEDYRNKVLRYLRENEYIFNEMEDPRVVVELHNFNRKEHPHPNGHLYIHELEEGSDKFEEILKYVLSKDRAFIPVSVICEPRTDYGLIKKILKENYGKRGRLTNGLLGLGGVFNVKTIKRK